MEEIERKYITDNNQKLMNLVEYNPNLAACLCASGALTQLEAQDLLDNVKSSQRVWELLRIMQGKENGYRKLIEVFSKDKANQTGAQALLLKLYDNNHVSPQNTSGTVNINQVSSQVTPTQAAIPFGVHSVSNLYSVSGCQSVIIGSKCEPLTTSSSETSPPVTIPDLDNIVEDLFNFYKNGDEAIMGNLKVSVKKPKYDMQSKFKKAYNLPVRNKGLALIINIKQFSDSRNIRHGAEHDGMYMRDLWKELGYTIFREDEIDWDLGEWDKQTITDYLEAFRKLCNSKKPASIVVFIGSHGEFNKILSSDQKMILLYDEIVSNFYDSNCPGLKNKPKVFLISACQGFGEPVTSDTKTLNSPVTDLVVCAAQAPGCSAYRSESSGSWFAHCLAYVFMKYARERSLLEMLAIVSEFFKRIPSAGKIMQNENNKLVPLDPGQIPKIDTIGMYDSVKPLYFFLDRE